MGRPVPLSDTTGLYKGSRVQVQKEPLPEDTRRSAQTSQRRTQMNGERRVNDEYVKCAAASSWRSL